MGLDHSEDSLWTKLNHIHIFLFKIHACVMWPWTDKGKRYHLVPFIFPPQAPVHNLVSTCVLAHEPFNGFHS